jgi:hypothetical protein
MAKLSRGDALLPAATRRETTLTPAEADLSASAIETFTKAVGGREALVEALSVASEAPEVEKIVLLLLDPRYETMTLRRICQMAGLTVADLFAAYRKAAIAEAHIKAAPIIAGKLVAVVDDVMTRGAPYEVPCTACAGLGTSTPEPTKDQPNPSLGPCRTCRGGGKLLAFPDLDRQKLALELGQLTTRSGGINIQQNLIAERAGSAAPGALEQLQQAVGDILFNRPASGGAVVEGAVVEGGSAGGSGPVSQAES